VRYSTCSFANVAILSDFQVICEVSHIKFALIAIFGRILRSSALVCSILVNTDNNNNYWSSSKLEKY